MEHICFEVQVCSKISIFKGIWNIDILINLCLGTGLLYNRPLHLLFSASHVDVVHHEKAYCDLHLHVALSFMDLHT